MRPVCAWFWTSCGHRTPDHWWSVDITLKYRWRGALHSCSEAGVSPVSTWTCFYHWTCFFSQGYRHLSAPLLGRWGAWAFADLSSQLDAWRLESQVFAKLCNTESSRFDRWAVTMFPNISERHCFLVGFGLGPWSPRCRFLLVCELRKCKCFHRDTHLANPETCCDSARNCHD